jgi:hypothetical protein
MDNALDVIEFAKEYVWDTMLKSNEFRLAEIPSVSDVRLDRELQYLLCEYSGRVLGFFGEITRRDVVLFVESWLAAQGTKPHHKTPYQIPLMPSRQYIN